MRKLFSNPFSPAVLIIVAAIVFGSTQAMSGGTSGSATGGATDCLGLTGATAAGCGLVNAASAAAQRVLLAMGFSDLSGRATTAQIGTGTPAAGKYVDGAAGAWTALPAAGASPAGSGSEINARSNGSTFQAVTGSSTLTGGIALVEQTAGNVPLSVTGASSQSGDLFQLTANAGTAGALFKINAAGRVFISDPGLNQGNSAISPQLQIGDSSAGYGFFRGANATDSLTVYAAANNGAVLSMRAGGNIGTLSGGQYFFSSSNSDPSIGNADTAIARGNAKVVEFTDGGGHAAAWQAGNASGTARPTCASGYRGTYWHVYGGAGVADTVAVCCKNVSDSYVWSTAFLSTGTCA
jgi:hypothetical protein